jgi:uncharacterized membrane protein
MLQGDALREYTRGSLWVLPTVSVAAAVIIGGLLSLVDVAPDFPLGFQGTADDARSLLIGITATMVTVIALLLGLAVVALQLSSTSTPTGPNTRSPEASPEPRDGEPRAVGRRYADVGLPAA